MTINLYHYVILQLLFHTANPLAVPFFGVQIAKGYFGTMINELTSNGLTRVAFTKFITNTRLLHLWVISAPTTPQKISRALQYASLENVMVSFGGLSNGAVAIATGGVRSLAANNLKEAICYNTTSVKTVILAENLIIGVLAICGTTGKTRCLELFKKLRGGFQTQLLLKPADSRVIQFHNNWNVIFDNMIREHTFRRYCNGCAWQAQIQRSYVKKFANPVLLTTSTLNTPAIFYWTVIGLTVTGLSVFGALCLFQWSERKRYSRYSTIIDITAEDCAE